VNHLGKEDTPAPDSLKEMEILRNKIKESGIFRAKAGLAQRQDESDISLT
jgi:hypothetical protein